MESVNFADGDLDVLRAIPRPGADVNDILRCFVYLQRAAPPSYDRFVACINNALAAGIVTMSNGTMTVDEDWYGRLHGPGDDECEELERFLVETNWPVKSWARIKIDEARYQRAAAQANPVNPYQPPPVSDHGSQLGNSRVIAIAFVVMSAIPTLLMLYWLGQHLITLDESPSRRDSPAVTAVGIVMSILTLLVGLPTSLIIKKICAATDHAIVNLFWYFVVFPICLGIVGPILIDWMTGSSLRT